MDILRGNFWVLHDEVLRILFAGQVYMDFHF
jgi:hypothetical protein